MLILQNDAVHRLTTTAVTIPLTTNMRRAPLPTCVSISRGDGRLAQDSVALCHQLRVLDKRRLQRKIGTIEPKTLSDVEACVLFTLGITAPSSTPSAIEPPLAES